MNAASRRRPPIRWRGFNQRRGFRAARVGPKRNAERARSTERPQHSRRFVWGAHCGPLGFGGGLPNVFHQRLGVDARLGARAAFLEVDAILLAYVSRHRCRQLVFGDGGDVIVHELGSSQQRVVEPYALRFAFAGRHVGRRRERRTPRGPTRSPPSRPRRQSPAARSRAASSFRCPIVPPRMVPLASSTTHRVRCTSCSTSLTMSLPRRALAFHAMDLNGSPGTSSRSSCSSVPPPRRRMAVRPLRASGAACGTVRLLASRPATARGSTLMMSGLGK